MNANKTRLHEMAVRFAIATAALAMALAMALSVAAAPARAWAGEGTEVSGADRYETAAAVSRAAYPSGAACAVLATGSNYPDALGASALAGILDCPVLLTAADGLPAATAAELSRLGARTVFAVGGTSAVPDAVLAQARTGSVAEVARIAGDDRYGTAEAVWRAGLPGGVAAQAGAASWGSDCILATGGGFADALSASGYAFARKAPVFLCEPGASPSAAVLSAVREGGFARALVVGGTAAVGAGAEDAVEREAGVEATRLSGPDRYATSAAVARFVQGELGAAGAPCVATGANFPDALAGCSLAGRNGGLVLLGAPGESGAFEPLGEGAYGSLFFLGGTESLPQSVRYAAECAAGWHEGESFGYEMAATTAQVPTSDCWCYPDRPIEYTTQTWEYPRFSGPAGSGVDAVNAAIAQSVEGSKGIRTTYCDFADYDLEYEVTYLEGCIASVRRSVYTWGRGGAHGWTYQEGAIYDLSTGETLTPWGYLGVSRELFEARVASSLKTWISSVGLSGYWGSRMDTQVATLAGESGRACFMSSSGMVYGTNMGDIGPTSASAPCIVVYGNGTAADGTLWKVA